MRYFVALILTAQLSGCASGQLDMYNAQGDKVGECTAGYNWHLIGVGASVDWLLNYCVELAKKDGYDIHSVSDESVLSKNYSYPSHPSGKKWTKKLAWSAFWSDIISQQQYGYIVADLENVFHLKTIEIREKLTSGKITKDEYNDLLLKAKFAFYGK